MIRLRPAIPLSSFLHCFLSWKVFPTVCRTTPIYGFSSYPVLFGVNRRDDKYSRQPLWQAAAICRPDCISENRRAKARSKHIGASHHRVTKHRVSMNAAENGTIHRMSRICDHF